jgi:hypothetical protein
MIVSEKRVVVARRLKNLPAPESELKKLFLTFFRYFAAGLEKIEPDEALFPVDYFASINQAINRLAEENTEDKKGSSFFLLVCAIKSNDNLSRALVEFFQQEDVICRLTSRDFYDQLSSELN